MIKSQMTVAVDDLEVQVITLDNVTVVGISQERHAQNGPPGRKEMRWIENCCPI